MELTQPFSEVSDMMAGEVTAYRGYGCPLVACRGDCSTCDIKTAISSRPR
jgi:hypothetical protein